MGGDPPGGVNAYPGSLEAAVEPADDQSVEEQFIQNGSSMLSKSKDEAGKLRQDEKNPGVSRSLVKLSYEIERLKKSGLK